MIRIRLIGLQYAVLLFLVHTSLTYAGRSVPDRYCHSELCEGKEQEQANHAGPGSGDYWQGESLVIGRWGGD